MGLATRKADHLETGTEQQPATPPHDAAHDAGGLPRLPALSIPQALKRRSDGGRRGRGWLVHRLLLAADLLGLTLAYFLAELLFEPGGGIPQELETLIFLGALPIWVITFQLSGLYGRDGERADHSTVDDFVRVFAVVTIGTWLFSTVAWTTEAVSQHPSRMLAFWVMAIGFVLSGRSIARALARRSPLFIQNAVIVGAGEVGQLIAHKLLQHPEYGIKLVGFVDAHPKERREDLGDLILLGPVEGLLDLVAVYDIDRVIIAFSSEPHERLLELAHELKAISVQIDLVPRLFEAVGPRVAMHTIEALPLIGLPPVRLSPSARVVKRSIDLVISAGALLVTAPLLPYIAFRIKRESPGPVFFRQTRLGLNMKEFTALKFRTMHADADDSEHREYIKATMSSRAAAGDNGLYKLDREQVVTPFGAWLRKTSLDELPQLINVLKGEMSLVGPRPCIPYETENFASYHFERFLVPAGMTGLWQVTARARSTFGEALDMDVAYARGWSLGLDVRLLCRTPIAMMRQAATT